MTHPPISEAVRLAAEAYAVARFVLHNRLEEAREYAMTDDSDSLNAGITEAKANADAALAHLIDVIRSLVEQYARAHDAAGRTETHATTQKPAKRSTRTRGR